MRVIVVTVPADAAELAADRLWSAGAGAVEERNGLGGLVELRTTLGSDDDVARRRLGDTPADWTVEFVEVDAQPTESWREHARLIEVSDRLVIRPAWLATDARPGVLDVVIEPGGAFGLGDHPTTRLSAAVVDEIVGPGDRVLDVGCGSGVLAVIAALRGADQVVAIDVAEPAREATIDNAQRNGVTVEASTTPLGEIDGDFDLVVANIVAPTLVSLAPALSSATATTGRLVVSGVLTGGYDHVVAALRPMQVVDERDDAGWSVVTLVHPSTAG